MEPSTKSEEQFHDNLVNQDEASRRKDHSTEHGIKRENDSMDDFEHLEHESSPNEAKGESSRGVQDARLIDLSFREDENVESARLEDFGRVASKLEKNILDCSLPIDEKILQPVPATPPPSANYDNLEERARRSTEEEEEDKDDTPRNIPRNEAKNNLEDEFSDEVSRESPSVLEIQSREKMDGKSASMAFVESERADNDAYSSRNFHDDLLGEKSFSPLITESSKVIMSSAEYYGALGSDFDQDSKKEGDEKSSTENKWKMDSGIEDSMNFENQKNFDDPPLTCDLPREVFDRDSSIEREAKSKTSVSGTRNLMDDETWNVVEKSYPRRETKHSDEAPTKPLPPLPKDDDDEDDENYVKMAFDPRPTPITTGAETGDSEFESAPEQSPAKTSVRSTSNESAYYSGRRVNADDIAPKEIFADMGLDAWFNPERLNPKVAALIYWRQPEKTGIVFGAILGVLLSLAYFSLISVFAYLSLLTLCVTISIRIYKTFMQAVQKTSDGHPFKDILEIDLTLPAEKVHEVADVAVAHVNEAVSELRRLFLVEDFIDSLKFGVALWSFTYLGSWFNGMTLIIIAVVALFTLPKVYETNKAQIDQNVALVHGKINELTAKVKAAIPLGKKSEPTKEE